MDDNLMKISIIVPMYNVEKYIDRCLSSLINQTYYRIEIILINDGSTDSTFNIAKKYADNDERIILLDFENKGVSAARNQGLNVATGDYCLFVDSDDWLDLDWIEKLIQKVKTDQVDVVVSGYYYNSHEQKRVLPSGEKNVKELLNMVADPMCECNSALWNKLILANLAKQFRFDETLSIGEDMLYLCQCIIAAQKILVIEEAGYHYFQRSDSAMSGVTEKMLTGILAYQKVDSYFESNNIDQSIRNIFSIRNTYYNSVYLVRAVKEKNPDMKVVEGIQDVVRNGYNEMLKTLPQSRIRRLLIQIISRNNPSFKFFNYIVSKWGG